MEDDIYIRYRGREIGIMKSNFSFLKDNKEYELFADACIDAENVASSAPALSVSGSRKALELAVKWLYAADEYLTLPYGRYTLQDLLHDKASYRALNNPHIQ